MTERTHNGWTLRAVPTHTIPLRWYGVAVNGDRRKWCGTKRSKRKVFEALERMIAEASDE